MNRLHRPDLKRAADKAIVILLDAADFDLGMEGAVEQARAPMPAVDVFKAGPTDASHKEIA